MFKLSVSFIFIGLFLIGLSSCGQKPENFGVKQKLNIAVEKKELSEINAHDVRGEINQQVITQSAMDKVSPEVLATLDLDLTTEYDVGEGGPREWGEEIWAWKILLKWSKNCDTSHPNVTEYSLNSSPYSFIEVACFYAPSGNTISQSFLFDKNTKESIQLELFEEDDPNRDGDNPEETWGTIKLDPETNVLSLVNRSAGGSCGTYRVYDFIEDDSLQSSKFKRNSFRARSCNINPALDNSPFEPSDYKNWPIIEDLSTLER